MEIKEVIALAIGLVVFVLKFSLGFNLKGSSFTYFGDKPFLWLKSILVAVLPAPLLALGLIQVLDLPKGAVIALAILGISPGAPLSPIKAFRAGGELSYSMSLLLWLNAICLITVPLMLSWFNTRYATGLQTSWDAIALQVGIAVVLPIGLGFLAGQLFPAWRERYGRGLVRWSFILLSVLGVGLLVFFHQSLWHTDGRTYVAYAVFLGLLLLAGHWLGGPRAEDRITLAHLSATRNLGLVLFLAALNYELPQVLATLMPYLVVLILMSAGYNAWVKRTRR